LSKDKSEKEVLLQINVFQEILQLKLTNRRTDQFFLANNQIINNFADKKQQPEEDAYPA
jgi:hypothetical protein